MRKEILFVLLMLPLLFAPQGQESIKGALTELKDTTQTFLGLTFMVLLVVGAAFTVIGAAIYFMMLKGKEQKSKLWMAAALIIGGLGILALIGAVISMLIYLLAPSLISGMMAG